MSHKVLLEGGRPSDVGSAAAAATRVSFEGAKTGRQEGGAAAESHLAPPNALKTLESQMEIRGGKFALMRLAGTW
jgi:hypothetical protein